MRRTFLLGFLVCLGVLLLGHHDALAIADIGKIEKGSRSFAETLVNLLGGPFGLILAALGIVAAFFESKVADSKALIFITILFTVGPFLLALALKGLYL